MAIQSSQGVGKHRLHHLLGIALALAAGMFVFHTGVLFEVARHVLVVNGWLVGHYGAANAGRLIVLGIFFVLFATHVVEAATWGLFFWRKGLCPNFTDGLYFSATSITTLGYGDVVLPPPWRILGPLVAISGTLMFGCSTAFLFLVLQKVWVMDL